jgi:hypothetical protein
VVAAFEGKTATSQQDNTLDDTTNFAISRKLESAFRRMLPQHARHFCVIALTVTCDTCHGFALLPVV